MTTLRALTTVFTKIFICCAVEIIFRPVDVLEHLQLAMITDHATRELAERLWVNYGARDILIGVVIYAAAWVWIQTSGGRYCYGERGCVC